MMDEDERTEGEGRPLYPNSALSERAAGAAGAVSFNYRWQSRYRYQLIMTARNTFLDVNLSMKKAPWWV